MSFPQRSISTALAFVLVGATLGIAPSAFAQKSSTLDDPTIVAIFDAANTWDIETGQLGAKKGTTKEVREMGEMLARDHGVVRQQGRDLAKKLAVQPTPPKDFGMAKDHAAAMTKLTQAKGEAFDRAFLQHEIAFHKAVIGAMDTTLLPSLKNQEVKDLVVKVEPAFKAHMAAAQNALDKMGK